MNTINELYDAEAEKHILGACLFDTAVLRDVSQILTHTDFLTVDHSLIFEACQRVLNNYGHIDVVLVADEMKRTGDLNRAGGTTYLYELQAPVVETESIPFYAKIVKTYAMRRNIIAKCADISNGARDINIDIEDLLTDLQHGTEDLINLQNQNGFQTQTALELSQKAFHPVKWIVPDLIPNGLTILAGPAKIGKSFLCWNLAFAVSMGGIAVSALDIPQQRNVLYLALDDDAALIQERHAMMLAGETPPNNLHIADASNTIKFDTIGLIYACQESRF